MSVTISYKNTSPWAFTPISGRFLGPLVYRPILAQPDDQPIVITAHRHVERPDLLSFDLYGVADFWWVFGVRNHLEDPVYDIQMNTFLFAPRRDYLFSIVG
jgi:hypothetical protein